MSAALSVDQALRKAKSLAKKGKSGDAEELLQAVLERFPGNRRVMDALQTGGGANKSGRPLTQEEANAALALYRQGRMAEAHEAVSALAARHPDVAFLHNLMGAIKAALGRTEEAVESYRRAVALKPGDAEAHNNLGEALNTLGRHGEALAALEKALRLKPDYADALCNTGNALTRLERQKEAVEALEKAIALRPDFAEAHNNLGNALNDLGRTDDAVAAFEKAIAARPVYAEAHRNLSTIKRYRDGDQQIAQMEHAMKTAKNASGDRMHLHFALGKAFDDSGDAERAFSHYSEGNRLRRQETGSPIEKERALFDTLRKAFAGDIPQLTVPAGETAKRPIFILGMPRSGTSLVEQILASHSQVHGGGELQFLRRAVTPVLDGGKPGVAALEKVRLSYLADIETLGTDAPAVTDKMPLNFRWIGFIATAFPEAAIIHTKRDPVATGWSIYKQSFPARGLEFTWDLDDIAAYYGLYEELMGFWHERFPGRIHDLDYEALTENQEDGTRALLSACDLDWDDNCLDFHKTESAVGTASAAQVRRKMYKGSSDAWKPYEAHLGPLIEALG
jgi:tetratricopeptide (TPR) repeat protein